MTPLPSKDQIRQWIADNPGLSSRRDIAKAFGLKGDQRADLRALLRELEAEGTVAKSARRFRPAGACRPWRFSASCGPTRPETFSPSRWKRAWTRTPAASW